MISAKHTVGEVAGRHPSTIELFEQFGIHYCCHGEQTIETVCAQLGLPADGLLSEINRAIQTNTIDNGPEPILDSVMRQLLKSRATLIHHHLPRIQVLVRTICLCRTHEHPNAPHVARIAEILAHKVMVHLHEEAEQLFPQIRELELAYVGERAANSPLQGLEKELSHMAQGHDELGELLSLLQELTGNYDTNGAECASYRELCEKLRELDENIRQEVHMENNVLFDRARQMSRAIYGEPTAAA